MPKTETFMCNKCHSVTDSFSSMEGLAHSCGGTWHYFDIEFYAQQSMHLTALRRWLAYVISLYIVLVLVVIYYGGR